MHENETFNGMTAEELYEDLRVQAKVILRGALDYFTDTIIFKLASDIELYKTCRYANPVEVRQVIGTR